MGAGLLTKTHVLDEKFFHWACAESFCHSRRYVGGFVGHIRPSEHTASAQPGKADENAKPRFTDNNQLERD
jgi:hypothetical protein